MSPRARQFHPPRPAGGPFAFVFSQPPPPTGSTVAFLNTNLMRHVTGTSVTDSTNMSVNAGGSQVLAVCHITWAGDGTGAAAISSVTFGGQTMTAVAPRVIHDVLDFYCQSFVLVNPPTGTQTLVVTGNASVVEFFYDVVAFTGVDQTTPVRPGSFNSFTSLSGDPSPETLTITSAPNDLTTTSFCTSGSNPTTNQTLDGSNSTGASIDSFCDHATVGASSVTHNWTFTGTASGVIIGFSIKHG